MRHAPLPGYRRPGGTAHSGGRGLTHAPARRAGDLDEYKRLSHLFSGTGAVKKWGGIDEDILEYCDPKCAHSTSKQAVRHVIRGLIQSQR